MALESGGRKCTETWPSFESRVPALALLPLIATVIGTLGGPRGGHERTDKRPWLLTPGFLNGVLNKGVILGRLEEH